MLKALVKQIDAVAEKWLPLPQPLDQNIISWASLHGWDASDIHCHRLLVRQALFNAIIRQTIPGIQRRTYGTPLDALGLEAPQPLVEAIYDAAQRSQALFNFWGELYNALIPQSERRRIGQFWTHEQVAEWMVAWLLQSRPQRLADIGCGAGNFLLKAAERLEKTHDATQLCGLDLSPLLLNVILAAFSTRRWNKPSVLPTLTLQNYLETALPANVDAVICNPPYTRHHHIAPALKDRLQAFFKTQLHLDVSRQGTLAFYFLLKLIAEMPDGARAAVIVPMEVLDARYGKVAKHVLCQHTALTALIHFSPEMNAFHKVDVGATIVLFRKGYERQNQVCNLTLNVLPGTDELLGCLETPCPGKRELAFGSLVVQPQNDLLEVPKWFSIATTESLTVDWETSGLVVPLKALARVVRGIATGANEFFVLPAQKVEQYSLEPYVVRTVHRNREIQDIILDEARWQTLADEGKCVWLLYLNGEDVSDPHLRNYLAEGEAVGYHQRSLVQSRKKWYAMEQRDIPPIFFTLLTRGNPRFILNRAGVRPLNMFLLIYPNPHLIRADATELLWALLNSNFSLSRLHSVSRTYGGNTLKVEPRELDNLPVINPLALPEDIRQRIKGWIDDFYRHQQASVLVRQVDKLIETLHEQILT
ncbi:MAG: N-6 DNA methylase [Acidobacteria bacterium]|nr:N-6 DNA methylase [Acidobacteriota bacterium]